MSDLKVGDWTVIDGQIMEVTGFAPDGVPVVRPLAPSQELAPPQAMQFRVGWVDDEGDGIPPKPMGPPILADPTRAERVEQIREAMRLAMANPGREVVFGIGEEAEDPDAAPG